MLNQNKTRPLLCFAVLLAAISAASLWACSVPVFRYALEHWPADSYEAMVFHRGPLSEAQRLLVRDLSRDGMAGRLHANAALRLVDLDQNPAPDALESWRQLAADTLPWLVLKYPPSVRWPVNIWSGPLTEPAVQKLLDSPVRKEIARRLLRGQNAVWVLLEIGDAKKDEAAADLLEARLAYLTGVLKLPKLEEQDIVNGLVSVGDKDLKLEFSFLRLSRKDPAELPFVNMLLGTEADLEETREPIVFPVFGRGRALYALVGKGINHETIDAAASFLIGSCSCQVKEQNPGVDLLLAADWDTVLNTAASAGRDLPASRALAESAPVTVTISGRDGAQSPSSAPVSNIRSSIPGIIVGGGLALFGLVAGGVLFLKKKSCAGRAHPIVAAGGRPENLPHEKAGRQSS